MAKNNFKQLQKQAKEAAIRKVRKQLEKDKEYLKLKQLELIIKNGNL